MSNNIHTFSGNSDKEYVIYRMHPSSITFSELKTEIENAGLDPYLDGTNYSDLGVWDNNIANRTFDGIAHTALQTLAGNNDDSFRGEGAVLFFPQENHMSAVTVNDTTLNYDKTSTESQLANSLSRFFETSPNADFYFILNAPLNIMSNIIHTFSGNSGKEYVIYRMHPSTITFPELKTEIENAGLDPYLDGTNYSDLGVWDNNIANRTFDGIAHTALQTLAGNNDEHSASYASLVFPQNNNYSLNVPDSSRDKYTIGGKEADHAAAGMGDYYFILNAPVAAANGNICFLAGTPIQTNQGQIPIEKLNPKIHTIRGKPIQAITKTITPDDSLIWFEPNSLGNNLPSQKTVISMNHKIFYQGKMTKAKYFVGNTGTYKIPYKQETLFNVLLDSHDKMVVNNMICETLDPRNTIAQLYMSLKKIPEEKHASVFSQYNAFCKIHNIYGTDSNRPKSKGAAFRPNL